MATAAIAAATAAIAATTIRETAPATAAEIIAIAITIGAADTMALAAVMTMIATPTGGVKIAGMMATTIIAAGIATATDATTTRRPCTCGGSGPSARPPHASVGMPQRQEPTEESSRLDQGKRHSVRV